MSYQSPVTVSEVQPGQVHTYQQVQPQFLQTAIGVLVAIGMGAWVLSQVKKAFRGEEVVKPF